MLHLPGYAALRSTEILAILVERFPRMGMEQFGHYRIRRPLATGGMSEVHLADVTLPGQVAQTVVLKRIRADHQDDPDFREFFAHEAQLAQRFDHPNVPRAIDAGEIDGVPYLAFEYVRGSTLLDLLRRASARQRLLGVELVLSVGIDLATALSYIHGLTASDGSSLGVVHRDLSPPNILVGLDGRIRLVDFGVARSSEQVHRTAVGVIKGRLAYLAPEQLRPGMPYDHRADLFVLGTVLYELATGRPLFRGTDDADTVRRVLDARMPPLDQVRTDVPAPVAQVIHRALSVSPDERQRSGDDFADDLREAARAAGLVPSTHTVRRELRDLLGADAPTELETPPPTTGGMRRQGGGHLVETVDVRALPTASRPAGTPPPQPRDVAVGTGQLARMRTVRVRPDEATPTPLPTRPVPPSSTSVLALPRGEATPTLGLAPLPDDATVVVSDTELRVQPATGVRPPTVDADPTTALRVSEVADAVVEPGATPAAKKRRRGKAAEAPASRWPRVLLVGLLAANAVAWFLIART